MKSRLGIETLVRKHIWDQAFVIDDPRYSPELWKLDAGGQPIYWYDYGKHTEFGWEIDHIVPLSCGGESYISNLQALHWRNNEAKGNKLWWTYEHGIWAGRFLYGVAPSVFYPLYYPFVIKFIPPEYILWRFPISGAYQ